MTELSQTPSQTIGPFFHPALLRDGVDDLDPQAAAGEPILLHGVVRDGDDAPVGDAMIEIWQPDGAGRYRHPADERADEVPEPFIGFGRVATGPDGAYRVRTAMPGAVPGPSGTVQAPHLNVQIFARGLLDKLGTRVYFDGVEANEADPILGSVPERRRGSLLARRDGEADGVPRYRFDIVLQGREETVFFDA